MRPLVLLFATAMVAAAGFGADGPASLPIETFFRAPEISRPRLSRDGTRVVFLVRNVPARTSIAVWDTRTQQGGLVFVPNDYNVDFAFWKGDRIVFGGDAGGNESYALRSIRPDGSGLRDLSESVDRYRGARGPVGGNLYSTLPDDPGHILVAGSGARRSASGEMQWGGELGLYRLDVGSGQRLAVELWDPHAITYFVDDRSGQVFGRLLEAGATQIVEIKTLRDEYREVGRFHGTDLPWTFVGLLPGEKQILLQVRSPQEHDRGALYAFDRTTLKRTQLLYEPPRGEIVSIKRGRDGRVIGVTREDERKSTDWFDPAWAKLYGALKSTFPGQQIDFVSSTDDARMHVVRVQSDRDPGAYYLYDAATPAVSLIGRVNPLVDPAKMCAREPIAYTARDGLKIHGYLTRAAPTKRPLILLPHGGPFGPRDTWEFDDDAQFLANRGYAVLQVNYRGSGGYGARFQAAGKREWGGKMQDDLTDAVHWAVAEGITAADQVGIYGASYGGYAVLAGLVFTPELYRCGANYVGVSDLWLLEHPNEPMPLTREVWGREWIGDDDAQLRARSPARFVDRIRVPSLHAYGENDPRVDINHWKVLESALKRHHKPYVFLRERDEGHGFEDEKSRIRFYAELEKFLAANLGDSGGVTLGELQTTELPARAGK